MRLLNSDIKQYQRLHKKYFDYDLNESEAREQVKCLVRQVEIIYQPITIAQFESHIKERSI